MLITTITCSNCHNAVDNNFCGNCGQPIQIKRIDKDYILHEIWHILHFDKGIFYTIKELLIRPGQNVKEFIATNRSRLVKPVIFIIITSLIYTLTSNFFHIEKGYVNFDGSKQSAIGLIFSWVQHHYGYANIIMGMYIAFWSKLFFSRYNYNFFEILILLCFVMGVGMLIFAAFAVIEGLTKVSLMNIAGAVAILYAIWAIGQFFDAKKVSSYFKALAAYMLGMIVFSLSLVLLGILIDFLKP
ncbi:DUF3667 domain-containing protein [Chitinophaga rhizophila]|uniref:DUF3667 domain-containing protein n=1 Tax=Chitinophaga rhizophila TaxID=2866212 RepID=A0ABS7GKW1_9BACT|nr:DUF3667 domain-containing protein [Chitinophaga rhizophila]MBW8688354.1 DUF3667 domain-containing protein [Chitinophaga rhizophila]